MAGLKLDLTGLKLDEGWLSDGVHYESIALRLGPLEWDEVARVSCRNNCGPQGPCSFYAYAKDGMVLRQELVGDYPLRNDPDVPDPNPRGCQKGIVNPHRVYSPSRLKYPMKRVGERGEGRWQRVTWDQAIEEIADALLDVLVADGPEVIALGAGGHGPGSATDGLSYATWANALDIPFSDGTAESGDEGPGLALTFGKSVFGVSADNFYHADLILVWGGNPAVTTMPFYHYNTAARYNGTRIFVIAPDYSASAIHADLWVPVNIGTDAALALSVAHVLVRDRLYDEHFIREQTDLTLLVRADTRRLLRERDLRRGGRDDIFYFWDTATGGLAEAPRKSLALDGKAPALEGEYRVGTLDGRVAVRPVFDVLKERLDGYSPAEAARTTGVSPDLIERLAKEIASSKAIMWATHYAWGKFYHGDLIERAILLVLVLGGHVGRKGACPWSVAVLAADFAFGAAEQRGDQLLVSAAAADPRWATWREDGYTDEMILYEYVREAFARKVLIGSSVFYYVHGGLLDLSDRHNSWDPYLQSRPGLKSRSGDYLREALQKGWHGVVPSPEKQPRVMFAIGGDFLRRVRASEVVKETLLPKLRLLVSVDWRMTATALYSDYVLPACGWYEKPSLRFMTPTLHPYQHLTNQVMQPLYESKNEWEIFCLLAKKMDERARERGITTFRDRSGNERRLGGLYDRVTALGMYAEDDLEGVVRDSFMNSSNLEKLTWEEFKERGYAAFTGEGKSSRSVGQATDFKQGEPMVPFRWHVEGKRPYPTTTRRIQFYIDHDWFLDLGEELPTQKDDPKAGGDYPLRLTGGHARGSVHSVHVEDSILLQLQRGEPVIFMSPQDARERGIQDGDTVEAYNDVGGFQIQAVVAPAVRPGQVIIYHAWVNYQFPGWRHFKNVMATPLNPVECVGGYYHLRPMTSALYPGHSDRDTRLDVKRVS